MFTNIDRRLLRAFKELDAMSDEEREAWFKRVRLHRGNSSGGTDSRISTSSATSQKSNSPTSAKSFNRNGQHLSRWSFMTPKKLLLH